MDKAEQLVRLQHAEKKLLLGDRLRRDAIREIFEQELYKAEGYEHFADYLEAKPDVTMALQEVKLPVSVRVPIVAKLAEEDLTQSATAKALGVGQATVNGDLRRGSKAVRSKSIKAARSLPKGSDEEPYWGWHRQPMTMAEQQQIRLTRLAGWIDKELAELEGIIPLMELDHRQQLREELTADRLDNWIEHIDGIRHKLRFVPSQQKEKRTWQKTDSAERGKRGLTVLPNSPPSST